MGRYEYRLKDYVKIYAIVQEDQLDFLTVIIVVVVVVIIISLNTQITICN